MKAYFSYNPLVDKDGSLETLRQLQSLFPGEVIDPFVLVPYGSKGDTPDNVRNRCYAAIEESDVLIAHIPRPYFYIGVIAEMEHAREKGISVYVITQDPGVAKRTWIKGLSVGIAPDVPGLGVMLQTEGLAGF
jgi:hypothetical protein